MGNMNKEEFICLDCETTGLDPKTDRIIEVAVMKFTMDEIIDQYETLVDPECPIPEASMKIHHITQDMVAGKPKIQEVLPSILKFIGKSIIVGHGIGFDVDILISSAERDKIPNMLRNNKLLDTLRMARHYGDSPVNSLEQLRRHFNIPEEGAHRAMNDVIVNREVFRYLAKRYRTTEEIFQLLSKPVKLKTMPLGPHKGRLMSEVPLQYLLWAANKDFDQDLLFTIRSEINRRKKGGLFNQAGNPFADL